MAAAKAVMAAAVARSNEPGQATMQQRSVLQDSSSDSTDVKVVVRVRPQILDMELQPGVQVCVDVEGHNVCTVRSPNETVSMPFNWVAGPATTQSEFFKVVGRPTVENCLLGFNSSIFAYGQTGSGKTHTMIGELPAEGNSSLPPDAGMIPRIFKYLWQRMPEVQADMLANPKSSSGGASLHSSSSSLAFAEMRKSLADDGSGRGAEQQPSYKWLVRCSMLEIHKEDVFDLLRPGSGSLTIREDIRKGVYVEGLCEKVVESVSDALDVLRAGIVNRQVAANDLNAASSRSHCIFTCHIESRLEPQAGMVNVRSSRLHLVDLAGSERLKTSWASAYAGSTGASVLSSWDGGSMSGGAGGGGNTRLKETTSINSSLTVLGLVILRLTEQQPHIPYRNSKLTFLLQDSIGGNAKTVIIANISPSEACVQETLSTLGFAARARKIVNKAVVNEDHNDDVTLLRHKVKRLQQELALARAVAAKASCGLRLSDNSLAASEAAQQAAQVAAQQLQEQQQQLTDALQLLSELGDRNTELEQAAEFYQRERDALEQNCLEARAELAAMQVSLQQALSENKGKKHGGFFRKADKASKAAAQSHQQQQDQASPLPSPASVAPASPADAAGNCSTGKPKQQSSPGWLLSGILGGRKDKAKAAAAAAAAAAVAAAGHRDVAQDEMQGNEECQQQQEHPQQQEQLQHMLQLVTQQLQELAAGVTPGSGQPYTAVADSVMAATPAAAGMDAGGSGTAVLQGGGLLQLQELQRQQDSLPQLQGIVGALRTLVAWRQQQQPTQHPQHAADAPASTSKASSSNVAPSELHRQLFEERELTSQLQARIRQLQQELLLAGGPAVAATVPMPTSASVTPVPAKHVSTAARLARLSPGMGVHYSADAACVRALHVAPTVLERTFAGVAAGSVDNAAAEPVPAAVAVQVPAGAELTSKVSYADTADAVLQGSPCCLAPEREDSSASLMLQAEPVVVQIHVSGTDNSKAAEAGPEAASIQQQGQPVSVTAEAAADAAEFITIAEQQQVIEALRAQVAELQERLHVSQRERVNFNSKLQSVKAIVAAARCSTPSSQLSSSLTCSQPSFGALEPVFGSSIIEEPELDESDDPESQDPADGPADCPERVGSTVLAGSLSSWHPEPEAASSPRTSPSRRLQSASDAPVGAHQPSLEEDLSQAEVWQQHHSQVQQYQLEYERKAQLTKAVHAAIAYGKQLGYRPFSPTEPEQQHTQQPSRPAPSEPRQQQDTQEAHQLAASSMQDDVQMGHQQQQREAEQQSLSLGQWHFAAGPSAVQGSTHTGGLHVSTDATGSQAASSSGSETTRSSGSTRGSYSDLEDEGAAAAGITQQPTSNSAHVGEPVVVEAAEQQPCFNQHNAAATVAAGAEAAGAASDGDADLPVRWPSGPAWDVSDYEEEVRQLSDQLQSMVSANSNLKAVLQQRDAELAAQKELLQQQTELLHQKSLDLQCTEQVLEDLQDRLAHSEAATASYATEHYDVVWLKGETEGLKELNQFLQDQLTEQAELLQLQSEELQELREQLDRSNQQDSKAEAEQADAAAATGADAAKQPAAPAVNCLSAEASTQTADQDGAAAGSPARTQVAADGDAVPHAEASHDQECKTPRAAAYVSGELQVAVAPASHTPGSKRRRHVQGGREGTPPHMVADRTQPMSPFRQLKVQTHALRAEPHNAQVAIEQRTLLQQQILTMGLQMQQRELEKQLLLVKQKLQEVQQGRDTASADVMSRLESPAHPDQCCSPQLEHVDSPVPLAVTARQSRLGPGGSSSPQVAARQAWLAAGGNADFMQQMGPMQALPAGTQDSPIVQQQDGTIAAGAEQHSRSASSSAASTPRSSGASTSGDSCAELLDELSELAEAVQKAAVASHQASTFKAVSASTLSPVRRSQQQLLLTGAGARTDAPAALLRSIDGSIAVSSLGSPAGFPPLPQQQQQQQICGSADKLAGALLDAATALDADATVKLQADLQVSSAYELAAARGFLHFEASLQELRSTLAGSKQDQQKQRQQPQGAVTTAGKQQSAQQGHVPSVAHNSPSSSQPGGNQRAQRQGDESPPVVRTLFGNYGSADAADPRASLEAAMAVAAVANHSTGGTAVLGSSSPGPQLQGFSMLRQLQQQQQYIIEVLGNLSAVQQQQGTVAGGSPTLTNPLQQLADAQQQLQVLLHAVGAVIQDAHANLADGTTAGGDSRQQLIALVGSGCLQGVSPGSRQGSGAWTGAFANDAGHNSTPDSSPVRQRKFTAQQQLLQGGSPDQQLQRDSSPDKLRRSQRAWLSPSAAGRAGQQQVGTADSIDSSVAARYGMQVAWPAEQPAGHAQQQDSQHNQQDVEQQVQELTQLRGQVLRLQLELQRAKQQAQAAECLISSCTSLGGRRSTSPDHAWVRRSQDSVSTPAAAASGASGSSAGTPTQLVLLSGRNKELQAQCMQRDSQIRQLESEVRRLQNELRQQVLAAAAPAGGPGAGGSLTPRGAATPRHGLGSVAGPGPSLFSPQRRAVSSPGATGTPRSFSSSGAAALGLPATVPSPALSGLAAPHASHVPTTRFAGACGPQGGYPESHMQPWQAQSYGQLPTVGECVPQGYRQQDQQQRELPAHSTAVVRASLDEVSCASTSSSRSRGKGIRVGSGKPPLAVPALKRKQ